MLSSDDFFANSASDGANAHGSKRIRVQSTASDDDILALLDEIDAVTATCDTFTSVAKPNHHTDPFNGHSISGAPLLVVGDEPQADTPNARPAGGTLDATTRDTIDTRHAGDQIKATNGLPHPFTASANHKQAMLDNARDLHIQSFTDNQPPIYGDMEVGKIDRLCGFVTEYERIGHNYKIILVYHQNTTPLTMTCQGTVFTEQPCHYGMLMHVNSVTCLRGHVIVTHSNVHKLYSNQHIINE